MLSPESPQAFVHGEPGTKSTSGGSGPGGITSGDILSVGYVSKHRGGSPSPQLLIGTVESEFLGEPSINFLL